MKPEPTPKPGSRRLLGRLRQHEAQRRPEPRLPARFRWIRQLGEGGMGEVCLAWDDELSREVALKRLHEDGSLRRRQRFEEEAKAMAALQHPHIVPVHELVREGEDSYLVMDYVAGRSLAERLEEGRLEPEEAVRIALALAEALRHAHARGVLHRDLKPGNVLLTPEGGVYLTDFGLAKRMASSVELSRTGELLGTPGFLAPEQIEDAKHADARTDVYGLGATLHAMLTGRPLFDAAGFRELMVQIVAAPPRDPRQDAPAVSQELASLCLRCLEKEPDARYPSAAALAEHLRALQEDRRLRPTGARRGWLASGLVAAALIGGLVAATRTRAPRPSPPRSGGDAEGRSPVSPVPTPERGPWERPAAVRLPSQVGGRGATFLGARDDRLVVSGYQGTQLWDLSREPPRVVWTQGKAGEQRALSSPGGGLLAVFRGGPGLHLLDAQGNLIYEKIWELQVLSAVFASDSSRLLLGDAGGALLELTAPAWEATRVRRFPSALRCLAYDPRSQQLACGWASSSSSEQSGLSVGPLDEPGPWRSCSLSGKPLLLIPGDTAGTWILGLSSGLIHVVPAAPSADASGQLDPRTALLAPVETLPDSFRLLGAHVSHSSGVVGLGLTSDGLLLSLSEPGFDLKSELRLWDLASRKLLGRLPVAGSARTLALSANRRFVALVTEERVTVLRTGHLVKQLKAGQGDW